MSLRVLIDCTQVARNKAGVGVYAFQTLQAMLPLDSSVHYLLVVQDDDPTLLFGSAGNVTTLIVPSKVFRKLPFRFLLEQLYLPWLAWRHRVDVVHSLHYSLPLLPLKARKVVTIHDMTFFLMPEVHLAPKVKYFQFFIRQAARRADQFIFQSYSSRDDFQKMFGRPASMCQVVHLGRSLLFHPGQDAERTAEALSRYGIKRPFLLYLGTLEPRKNLTRLLEAFAQIASRFTSHTLVLAGGKGWMCDDLPALVVRSGLEERVLLPGFIAEEDKPYLMGAADVFTYPSLYEGFGIPLLEAMSCGVPALSSRTSSLPEVAGDAALLVDPLATDEIRDGLARLLGEPALRASFAEKGLAQAATFDWSRTAAETLRVYRVAAGQR